MKIAGLYDIFDEKWKELQTAYIISDLHFGEDDLKEALLLVLGERNPSIKNNINQMMQNAKNNLKNKDNDNMFVITFDAL